jgi:AmmeMemoRadiSam system protein B
VLHADHLAHRHEHAIEVLLPFLQHLGPSDLAIVPMIIGSEAPDELTLMADAMAGLLRNGGRSVLLIASSDFTHYEPHEAAREKDAQVIEMIRRLDGERFLRCVRELPVTMCGSVAVACVLRAATRLGATRAELICYGTSAETGGDPQSVVGYAGILLN